MSRFTGSWRLIALLLVLSLAVLAAGCGSGTAPADDAGGGAGETQTGQDNAGTGDAEGGAEGNAETGDAGESGALPEVEIVVFQPPSLGYFLAPVIEARGFDRQNGIRINFVQRPSGAYNTEFAAGHYQVGASAALLSEGLRHNRGLEVVYLFNLFDFFGAVVTDDPAIETLQDLEGKSMAAATVTTNYAMFLYFATKSGVDLSTIEVQNTEVPGLAAALNAGRVDAVEMWEPAVSQLLHEDPDRYHLVPFGIDRWNEFTGGGSIPYLGVAAHHAWVEENPELVEKIYAAYKAAADWVTQNPAEAAAVIGEATDLDPAVIEDLINNNDRLGLNVVPASAVADDIRAVFQAGLEIEYFDAMPDDAVIYQGLK